MDFRISAKSSCWMSRVRRVTALPSSLVRVEARAGEDGVAGCCQQLVGGALVHHVELRGEVRFQGEAAQQRLAEGVDGLDLHAAGAVHHLGEQPAGAGPHVGVGAVAGQVGEVVFQAGVGERRPAGQRVVDADRHFRRRRLGEGQAEDARRLGSGQHQAQHAVGQHLGLAGAGGGSDPDGAFRVGCAALLDVGVDRAGGQFDDAHGSRSVFPRGWGTEALRPSTPPAVRGTEGLLIPRAPRRRRTIPGRGRDGRNRCSAAPSPGGGASGRGWRGRRRCGSGRSGRSGPVRPGRRGRL